METLILEGTLTLLSSLSHNGGDKAGTVALLRREDIMQPSGQPESVVVLSGNAIRGRFRDAAMLHMLRELGYGEEPATQLATQTQGASRDGDTLGLSLPALHFLFSGGTLTGEGGKAVSLAAMERWRQLLPLVSLLGGAVGNVILPGKLKVGKALPICRETAHLLPRALPHPRGDPVPIATHPQAQTSIYDLTQRELFTRRDDAKNPHYWPLLAPEVRGALTEGLQTQRARREGGEAQALARGTAQQMLAYTETLKAGTVLYWKLVACDLTPVEFDALLTGLAVFSRLPYLGGKSSVGHGEVAFHLPSWVRIDSRLQPQSEAVDAAVGTRYQAHLRTHAAQIREVLGGLR